MSNLEKPKNKIFDLMLWAAVLLCTLAAFFVTYSLHLSGAVLALVWVCWLVLSLLLGYFTSQGKNVFSFAKEAKVEMQKVVWPTRPETIQTTSIVMIMVAVTGFVLWGIDTAMTLAIGKLTHLG